MTDADGGVHSVPEREFTLLVRRYGLPEPTRQAVFRRPDGRFYLDVAWERYGVVVEVHGAHHRAVDQWEADLDRHNEITASGRRVLHVSAYAVRHHPERVAAVVRAALRAAGANL